MEGNKARRGTSKQRIFLVEDYPILREGLTALLNREPDFQVCGEAENCRSALAAIVQAQPDLVLLDIELNGDQGLDLIKRIRARYPAIPILVISAHEEHLYAQKAMLCGAHGYVMKQAAVEEVLGAIRRVLAGEQYLSPKMQERMRYFSEKDRNANGPAVERLSTRERQVFDLIGRGARTRDIAQTLGVSVKTIDTYRAHLLEKLKLKDATELVHFAISTVQG